MRPYLHITAKMSGRLSDMVSETILKVCFKHIFSEFVISQVSVPRAFKKARVVSLQKHEEKSRAEDC